MSPASGAASPGTMPNRATPARHWWTTALSAALLLTTPLIVFLRYQSYSLWEPESLGCLALLGLSGAAVGLLFEAGGSVGRALLYALLIALTVDIQSDEPERWRLILASFAISLGLLLLLRHRLPRWGPAILGVYFLLSVVGPTSHGTLGERAGLTAEAPRPGLPVVVHLILDGHLGVEGIPAEFDPDGSASRRIRDLYLAHGFQVFGRAYSRYYRTHTSIPALLNFETPRRRQKYVVRNGANWILKKNRYFEEMSRRGFAIRVLQSTYMDYCGSDDSSNLESCWTFDPQRLNALQDTRLAAWIKVRAIFGMYSRLSNIVTSIDVPTADVTPIATLPVMQGLADEISQATPGTLFFAHLLLPHSPYGLLADCQARPDLDSWLMNHDENVLRRRNTDATRRLRYPQYLAQLECVNRSMDDFLSQLENSPHADSMVIVIHGDHGSRLDRGPLEMRTIKGLESSDYVDAFSTLFVCKRPGTSASYDRRMLPLEKLFEQFVRNDSIPQGETWAGETQVFLRQGSRFQPMPMPTFGRDPGPGTVGRQE